MSSQKCMWRSQKDVHYSLKRSDVNVYYKNVIQSCCNVNITDEAFQCNVRKEKKKKRMNVYLFFLQGIHVHPESVAINTTPAILTRCYEEHL